MKTTVEIPNPLLQEVRRLAEREGTTLKSLLEEALRRLLADRKRSAPFKLGPASFKGDGYTAEFTNATWDKIRDATYKGRGT
jgi:hypothetical protein